MASKRIWVISAVSLAVTGLCGYLVLRPSGECPVKLPSNYQLVAHFEGLNSADLAMELKTPSMPPTMGVGTAQDWLFESPGKKEDAAWSLLLHLRKSGNWRQLPSRSHIIYSDNGRTPKVVMFSDRSDSNSHFVRVNGNWRSPGMIEEAISKLPASWIERFKSKR